MSSDRLKKRIDSRFFPVIFDAISHGIFTIDSDGLITGFNRKAEQLTGYKKPRFIEFRDELPKSNVGKILRRELRDAELAAMKARKSA